ncbi:muscle M-line assembly protein unc-89 isoform X1 [Lingula anatina]|uniref:Muscle M-line assembly protein unc-89 isoform X1 n=3 Tax=Lingula anatina TaxID=7574 RepID=A0A1S3JPZ8_LINAN|nr:muscle M-line assembly protein unc-89 isoform X1 [Lingula anatina]|eukprot:XP_013412432.1 muscle M-line assembly protein unc-89 isoform X1 [Lingula anatina]
MSEYTGMSETALKSMLDRCTNFDERRKIRAAIRNAKNGSLGGPSQSNHSGGGRLLHNTMASRLGRGNSFDRAGSSYIGTCQSSFGTREYSTNRDQGRVTSGTGRYNDKSRHIDDVSSKVGSARKVSQVDSLGKAGSSRKTSRDESSVGSYNPATSGSRRPSRDLSQKTTNIRRSKEYEPSRGSGSNRRTSRDETLTVSNNKSLMSGASGIKDIGGKHVSIGDVQDEAELEKMLRESHDFDERRKIRAQLRKIRDEKEKSKRSSSQSHNNNKKEDRGKNEDRSKKTVSEQMKKASNETAMEVNYEAIEDEEELTRLLNATDDYFVKKKIRAALRGLRKKGETVEQMPARKSSAVSIVTNKANQDTKKISSVNVKDIQDEQTLEKMRNTLTKLHKELEETRDFDKRREIRAAMRELRAKIRDGKVQSATNDTSSKISPREQTTSKSARKSIVQEVKADAPKKVSNVTANSHLPQDNKKETEKQKSPFSPILQEATDIGEAQVSLETEKSNDLVNEKAAVPSEVCDETENNIVLLPDFTDTTSDVKVTKSNDGTITIEQCKEEDGGLKKVSMSFKQKRTDSQSDEVEKDTVVITEKEEPDGEKIEEKEEVITKKKLSSKGSFLVKRDTKVSTKYRTKSGTEFIDEEILTEEDSKSVSKGTASHMEMHSTIHKEKPTGKLELKDANTEAEKEVFAASDKEIQNDEIQQVKETSDISDTADASVSGERGSTITQLSENQFCNVSSRQNEVVSKDVQVKEEGSTKDSQQKREIGSTAEGLHVAEAVRDLSKRSSGYGSDKDASEEDVKDDIFEEKLKDAGLKPTISCPLADLSVLDGETATFKCECLNADNASVSWHKNGKLLKPSKDFQQTFDGRTATLMIDEVFPEESGEFKCTFNTKTGQAESTAKMIVKDNPNLVSPAFTKQLSDQIVMDGDKVSLECEVSGTPKPTVLWYKGSKVLKNCSDFKQSFDGVKAVLCITEVFPDDTGKFTCEAKNEAGEAKSTCQLTVKEYSQEEEEKQAPSLPRFTKSLMDIVAEDGQKVELECTVEASPEPTISWYKDGLIISKKNPDFTQVFSDGVAKLVISEVLPDDEGQFKCLVKNSVGEAETVANLKLKVPPIEGRSPEILQPLKDMVAVDGKPMSLQCQFSAVPEPTVTWYKKGKPLTEDADFKLYFQDGVAKLEIMEVFPEDEGEYDCVAKNEFGEAKCSCRMDVKANRPVEGKDPSVSANIESVLEDSVTTDTDVVDRAVTDSEQNLENKEDTEMKDKVAEVDRAVTDTVAEEISENKMADDRDVDEINEEDVLQRMLNNTQDFDQRKKIRNRIKHLRELHKNQKLGIQDKQREEETKARQMASQDEMKRREKLEDEAKAARLAAMTKKHESAVPDFTKADAASKDAAKARQLKKFEEDAKSSQLGAKSGADAGTKLLKEKADAQKQATMKAYGRIAEDEAFDKTITDVTTTTVKDGASSKTTTTTTTKTSSGFTKKSAPPDAQSLAEQFSNCSSPGTSGSITVKYQAWNSRDGLIENTEQTKTWGGGTHNLSKSKYPSTLANLGKSRGAIAALGSLLHFLFLFLFIPLFVLIIVVTSI